MFLAHAWSSCRRQRSFSLPRLGRRALGTLGAAYDELRDALAARPPLLFGPVEDRVLLAEVLHPSMSALGLVPGQELELVAPQA